GFRRQRHARQQVVGLTRLLEQRADFLRASLLEQEISVSREQEVVAYAERQRLAEMPLGKDGLAEAPGEFRQPCQRPQADLGGRIRPRLELGLQLVIGSARLAGRAVDGGAAPGCKQVARKRLERAAFFARR